MQEHNAEEVITEYASRVLNKAEKYHGIAEKEVLAIRCAVERFHYFLKGKQFKFHQTIKL